MARRWTCPVNLAIREEEFRRHTHEWTADDQRARPGRLVCKRCGAEKPDDRGTT
jgi:hypothetical protein